MKIEYVAPPEIAKKMMSYLGEFEDQLLKEIIASFNIGPNMRMTARQMIEAESLYLGNQTRLNLQRAIDDIMRCESSTLFFISGPCCSRGE